MQTVLQMRQERAKIADAAEQCLKLASEGTDKDENESKFDELMKDYDARGKDIARAERLEASRKELDAIVEERAADKRVSPDEVRDGDKRESVVFEAWCKGGIHNLSDDDRAFMAKRRVKSQQSVGTPSEGGYAVPEGFVSEVEVAMLEFGGMREVSTIRRTATGNDLPWPTINDANQEGELVGENAPVSQQAVVFGNVMLNAYKYSSKTVLMSLEFMQDEEVGFVQTELARLLGDRLGRIINRHTTVGTGTAQPNGIVTAAAEGLVGSLGTGITYDELVDLEHSVDPAYRNGSRYMFHDDSLAVLRKLVDLDGRPLWQNNAREGAPDTINGRPYTINQHMAPMAIDAKSIVYGALTKYIIRQVMDMTLFRLGEKYIEDGQIGFLAFARADGELLDAGTDPVKYFQNAAA